MKKCLITGFLGIFILFGGLFGAEITVSNLELATRGKMDDGDFTVQSSLGAEISVSGGYKYGFALGLGAEIINLQKALSYGRLDLLPLTGGTGPTDTEYNDLLTELNDRHNNQAYISIRSLKATAREVFDKPLELSFFIGYHDKLASGDDFPVYFGTPEIGTSLKGFFYYPEGFNNEPFLRFNGAIHTIKGTGLSVKALLGSFIPVLYIYHDLSFPKDQSLRNQGSSYDPDRYSTDLKLIFNKENVKMEIFTGGTFSSSDKAVLRGGILAWFGSGPFAFLLQAGIPHWEAGSSLDIDNYYFLMEPRFRLEKFGACLTFFYHPVFYNNKVIYDSGGMDERRGRADINLRAFFGDVKKSAFEAGAEALINLKIPEREEFGLWISPYISTVTTGLRWDFALRINPRYFRDKGELMEGFIGIRTSY